MWERITYPGTRKLPSIFTKEEINRLLQSIKDSDDYWKNEGNKEMANWLKTRDMTLIATIYILGLRPKEGCCLRFDDFNLRDMTVKIRGENNKNHKDRVIPIPKALIEFLKIFFKFPRKRFWKSSRFLFPSLENEHISPERLKHIFREKCLKPAGLWDMPQNAKAEYRTIYKLRHSRASHILNKQIKETGKPDIYAIANFLGHSDIRSTTVYLHTDEAYMDYMRGQTEL